MPYVGRNPDKGNFSDLNGAKLILDADADTSITSDTDDQIDIEIAGSDELKITAAMIAPATADGSALGGASNEWSDLYLAESGIIYFGADQDVTVTHDPDDGLFLKSKATADNNPVLLTLQTGETDMAADDIIGAIQFQAPDEGTGTDAVLVSGAIKAYAEGDHSSSSNATSLAFYTGASEVATEKMTITSAGKVGIGVTGNPIDEIFHIETSVNDATLKMESTGGQAMIDIVGNRTSDADIGHLRFHNAANGSLAQLRVERSGANNTGLLKLQVNKAGTLTDPGVVINSDAQLMVNETANANMTHGLTLNQAAIDTEIFAVKSSDVAHGTTALLETDTYGAISKAGATTGGIKVTGATEASIGVWLYGVGNVPTDSDVASSIGQVVIGGATDDGSTGVADCGADDNIVVMRNNSTTRWLIKGDGDVHQTTDAHTALDSFADADVCRAFDLEMADPASIIKDKWDEFLTDRKETLIRAGILPRMTEDQLADGDRPLFNASQLQRLHNGAISQMSSQIKDMTEELSDIKQQLGLLPAVKRFFLGSAK